MWMSVVFKLECFDDELVELRAEIKLQRISFMILEDSVMAVEEIHFRPESQGQATQNKGTHLQYIIDHLYFQLFDSIP